MADRYENIRRALAMGPTPGPRRVVGITSVGSGMGYYSVATTDDTIICALYDRPSGDAHLITACDPDTIRALLEERDELAKDAARYRWLRKGANDDIAVVRGLGAMDYGMSAVAYTYSEEIDGDDLDASIDAMLKNSTGDEDES